MVGTICSPGWNRVNAAAKRWFVRVPIVPPVFTSTPAVPRSNIGRPNAYLYQKYIPTIYIEWRKSDQTKNPVHSAHHQKVMFDHHQSRRRKEKVPLSVHNIAPIQRLACTSYSVRVRFYHNISSKLG